MSLGVVGKKCGMTRLFDENGAAVPVTVILVEPNRVVQVKTMEKDGYQAIQITNGEKKISRVNKPMAGHFAKANVAAGNGLWEFDLTDHANVEFKQGDELTVSLFKEGQLVDVQGVSKGKGFAGVIKRYHFRTQDATHGNSLSHRAPGSIGQRQTPGRVFKGKKMCGHMGSDTKTIQNLKIVKVDVERNLLLIKGAIPGATSGNVIVIPARKSQSEKGEL